MKLLITTQTIDINDPILGFFHRWVEEFAKYFERIDVICLYEGEHTLPTHVHVHSLGKEGGENRLKYTWRFYRYFFDIYMRGHVDFVFFHMGAIYNILATPFFLIRRTKKARFYWWKAHGKINVLGRIALVFVDRVYTSTGSGFPIKTPKRRVIGQAIDTSLFTSTGNEARTDLIFVGRISPVKKIEIFLEAYALLRKAHPELGALIVGPVADEAYLKELKTTCQHLGIEQDIFIGSRTQSELVSIYKKALVFLNTSETHSMDKTVLEAILCGCIPVTGNRAFKDILSRWGLFADERTPEAYADLIKTVLATDRKRISNALMEYVKEKHSIDTFVKRIFM